MTITDIAYIVTIIIKKYHLQQLWQTVAGGQVIGNTLVYQMCLEQCATAYRTNWRPWLDGRLKVPDFITLKPIAPALKNDGRHSD
ncbi:UNVERIFIED_CONTAM: hypothetical protein FKN15_066449 [Acipenser sinensis]